MTNFSELFSLAFSSIKSLSDSFPSLFVSFLSSIRIYFVSKEFEFDLNVKFKLFDEVLYSCSSSSFTSKLFFNLLC